MLIDLRCPVELRSYEILHDDRGNARAYIRLFNLSHRRISRLEALALFTDKSGKQITQPLTVDNPHAGARAFFTVKSAFDNIPDTAELNITFSRISFESGAPEWIGNPTHIVSIPDVPKLSGRALNALTAAVGSDAVCYPTYTESHWVCVCGRPNLPRRKKCVRCGRNRASLMRLPSVSESQNVLFRPHKTVFSIAPQELYRRFARQRSILIRRTITMLIVALLLLLITLLYKKPGSDAQPGKDYIPPVKISSHSAV